MERYKTKLTMEQILEDFKLSRDRVIPPFGMVAVILLMVPLIAVCTADVLSGKIAAGVIAVSIVCFLTALKSKYIPKKELGSDDFQIMEDYVIKLERRNECRASAYFQKSGMIPINYNEANGNYHRRPMLREVRIGDRFYVVSTKSGHCYLLYDRKEWRLNDLTDEQIAAELREEDELIARIMECERFPKLTMHRDHYAEDGHRYQLDMTEQKTDAEYNLMERLAIKHFLGDWLNAMEYLVRYCPAEIQGNTVKTMTKLQKVLAANILRYMKEDEKKAGREERIEKIKSLFDRSDEL